MSHKKFIFAISFLTIFGFIFNFGAADVKAAMTIAEIQALIAQLQQQIAQLQQQLSQLQVQGEQKTWCYDFNRNLKYGEGGSDVSALQTALEKEGFYKRTISGYFDEYTASAVVAFQEKYKEDILSPWGLEHGTGYVGSTTRGKLNKIYGCGAVVSPQPPVSGKPFIAVLSPIKGEKWVKGSRYRIKWSAGGLEGENVGILLKGFDQNQNSLGGEMYSIIDNFPVKNGEYLWTIPSDLYSYFSSIPAYFQIMIYDTKRPGTLYVSNLFTIIDQPTGIFYTLSVSKTGTGSGRITSNPAGINCGSDCSENYLSGTNVTLTAVAENDSSFSGWSGACSGASPTCTIRMDTAKSVSVNFVKQGIIQSVPNSIIDTISLNPSGTIPGTGGTLFGANTDFGYDYAFGFAFKTASARKIKAVEFLAQQKELGKSAVALLYKGRGLIGGDDLFYWTPQYNIPSIATFNLVSPSLSSIDTESFHIFRFEVSSPINIDANTPYVIVFDPEATADGKGVYVLPNIAQDKGFLSTVGTPDKDVFMPSYLVKRMTDIRKSYLYNQWSFLRKDRRCLVKLITE